MKFTVVVPTYNRALLLERCLASLAAQNYADYEVIVVDDGSTDDTGAVVEDFPRVKYLRQDNRGPAAARNLGWTHADGEVIAFIDDDCVAPPDWLFRLAEAYERYPQVSGVGGFLEAPPEVLESSLLAQYEQYMTRNVYQARDEECLGGFECPAGGTCNMSYRRKVLVGVGGFDESFPVAAGEDAELKLRICQGGHRLLYIPLKVTHLRPYTWRSFLRQSFQRGLGVFYFESKHGRPPSWARVSLRIAKRLALFGADGVRRPRFAFVNLIGGVLDCVGQGAALRQRGKSRPHGR